MHPFLTWYIDNTFAHQIRSLQEQIRIPSVKAEALPRMPFGQAVSDSLDHALALARQLGLSSARSLDGYIGIVDVGEGEETLGVLCHLDVVPAGSGWTYPPFGGELHDQRIYGRGAIDDKGPAMSALYALAAIANSNLPLKRRIRLLLGCDEEQGWGCMRHYEQREPMPDIAFSPDASYPLVNSEKGIVQCFFEKPLKASAISIQCGTRANVVPGQAQAFVPLAQERVQSHLEAYRRAHNVDVTLQSDGDGTRITVHGVGGHAAMPEIATNALQGLIGFLAALPLAPDDAQTVQFLWNALRMDQHGEQLGLDFSDASGRLTLNPGVLDWSVQRARLALDIRYPISLQRDTLLETLSTTFANGGFALVDTHDQPPHYVAPEHELVQTLLDVYARHAGVRLPPLAIGGGTYARTIPNAVAFGCERPGDKALAHMPDECIALRDILFNTRILADAMLALAGAQES